MKFECTNCHITLEEDEINLKYNNKCPMCGRMNTFVKEYVMDIKRISTDESFVNAMIQLYENDPVEYQLKIQQFRIQLQQQEQAEEAKKHCNQITCPNCGSTAITTGQRGFSAFFGFIGSDETVNRCANCGHKWRP